jgi:DNA-binding NarL/FixJ family response regulator
VVIVLRTDGARPADVVPVPAPHVRVLALAADAAGARAALAAGAHSAAIDGDDEGLVAVVAAVGAGYAVSPESLRGRLSQGLLTTREKQALAMVVMGFSNREIGTTLHITETTVKSHLSSAFRKLHVRSRHEATALILDPESGAGTGILAIS